MSNPIGSEGEGNGTPTLVAPTTTIIDPSHPEPLDVIYLIDGNSSSKPQHFTSNSIELEEQLELIDTDDP